MEKCKGRDYEELLFAIAIGTCVWYSDFALRIDSMHGDKITRIEVIKSV